MAYIRACEQLSKNRGFDTEYVTEGIITQLWTHSHLQAEEEADNLEAAIKTVLGRFWIEMNEK